MNLERSCIEESLLERSEMEERIGCVKLFLVLVLFFLLHTAHILSIKRLLVKMIQL